MAKALKTAALVVGAVALVATGVGAVALGGLAGAVTIGGVSASTLFLVSGGLTVASSLLQKTPKVPAAQTDRLNASVDPRAFRKTVLGQTAMPVDIRYEEWSGKDQEYCDWIVLHASHASDGLEEIWFDTEMAWSATTGVVGKWAGYFSVPHIVLEGSAANAFSIGSGRWNQSARLTGCTYSHWRFKVTGNGKKAESPFSSGLPSRITVIGRGAKLYDPRRDSTVPGGSGPMRAADQSTWRYTADDGAVIGENLALHTLRVALGWRIKNPATGEMRLATGSGVPARRLNLQSWIVAANLADEQVNRSAGGTEPRYHGACVISEGDDPKSSLDMLCTACCGRFRDTAGKLSFTIAHNDLAGAATDDGLTTDDVVGPFTWDPDAALEATPNIARGKYVDASVNSLYQMIDYPEVRLPSPDGQDRIFPLDLGAVESPSQAQRIAKQVLQRKQYPRRFSAPFDIRAWKYSAGDVVPFTFAPLGFTRALFRVEEQELGQGGTCNMTLLVENASLYAWDKDDAAPVQAAAPIVYDNRNNPLILAIADAATTAEWPGVGDPAGTKPDDNATNSADPNSPFGPVTVGEALATLDRIEPLGEAIELLDKAQIGYDALQRQATRDGAQLHDAVLRGILESDRTRTVMRDAGITVDPASGRVFIAAVDQVSQRTSRVEIDLDATKTLIALSASRDYVNEQIAAAQLDPSGQAALEEVLLRLTKAEIRLDGDEAAISLKADATVVTLLSGRVSSVRQDLDALAGVVSTKAETTVVDKLGTKVSAVEERLGALGDTTGYSIDIRQARYQADTAAGNALEAILGSDDLNRRQLVAAAQVRQELYTRLVDGDAVEAAARTLLSVRLGTAEAAAAAETFARVEQGKALAQATSALEAKVGQDIAATVRTLNQAIADGDKVSASSITQLGTRLDNFGGVTIEQSFKTLVDRTGKIEARYTVAIDANGNLSGFQLIGSDAGPASFNLINTDLKMGTGRIIFRGGSYESRGGANFGANGNLVEWFGPAAVPLGQETILNSRFCTANDGKVYYGGEDLSNGGFSANRVKQMPVTGSVGFSGNDTKQLSVASATFPTGGKIKITGRLTAANARRDGGNGTEVSGFWIIRFYANYGSGPQLIVETECSITPGAADLYDGILALSGRLFDNPGPGGPVNLSATVQRGGDPNSGIASNWTGSAIVEWVNA